jgi:hypothetical protein
MNKLSLSLLLAFTFFCATCVFAQDTKESHTLSHVQPDTPASHTSTSTDHDAHFYKLAFVIEEKDGARVVDRREYQLVADSQDYSGSSLRSGDKVPIVTMDKAPIVTTDKDKGEQQYQYMDMGASIDARDVVLLGDAVALNLSVKVERMPDNTGGPTEKIVRNQQWSSRVLAALNKSTEIFSSQDPNSTHTFTVSLTPTLLK